MNALSLRADLASRWARVAAADAPVDARTGQLLVLARYHGVVELLRGYLAAALAGEAAPDASVLADWAGSALRSPGLASALGAALREASLHYAQWDLANRRLAADVVRAFEREGIPTLLLKGAGLAYTLYAHPAQRPRTDVDILVPFELRERALELLADEGHARAHGVTGQWISYQASLAIRDRFGVDHAVDLHWRVNNSQWIAKALSFAELAEGSLPVPAIAPAARTPGRVHALLLACAHLAGHRHAGFATEGSVDDEPVRLIWVHDLHALWRAMDHDERERFVRLAVDKRLAGVCAAGLANAQACFGTERCSAAVLLADEARRRPEPTRFLLESGPVAAFIHELGALDGVGPRLGLVRETLFPPRAYLRAKYPDARVRWAPVLYTRRILGRAWPR